MYGKVWSNRSVDASLYSKQFIGIFFTTYPRLLIRICKLLLLSECCFSLSTNNTSCLRSVEQTVINSDILCKIHLKAINSTGKESECCFHNESDAYAFGRACVRREDLFICGFERAHTILLWLYYAEKEITNQKVKFRCGSKWRQSVEQRLKLNCLSSASNMNNSNIPSSRMQLKWKWLCMCVWVCLFVSVVWRWLP